MVETNSDKQGTRYQKFLNDRCLEINWVAGKPPPTIGNKRCNPVLNAEIGTDCKVHSRRSNLIKPEIWL